MERLNPLSDVVFSNIFRDMSSAPAMLGFINAVLRAAGDAVIALPDNMAQGCYIVKLMRNGSAVKYQKLMVK